MSEKLDELFKEFEGVFIARAEEIKDYLFKYKKDDFQTRDVIDVRRRDATERLNTSGFRKNLSMWQNFYKNVIVSSCVEIDGEKKRYDYKFYFTEEKIDSELLEEVENIISEINKLKARMHFDEALQKVENIEEMVKDKEDKYFNEQLRILRKDIKDARKEYNEKLQQIEELKSDLKDDQKNNNYEGALKKGNKIIKLAKSIQKRKIQKEYESILEGLKREKIKREISELEQKFEENKDLDRYSTANENCQKIIELADSLGNKEIKKKYRKEIKNIDEKLQNLKEDQKLKNKIKTLEDELKDKQEEANYRESLELVVEIIQLASLLGDKETWEKYTELKNELISKLEEQKKQKREKERKNQIQELEKTLREKQEHDDFQGVIDCAEKIISIASEINNQEKVDHYQSLIERTNEEIKKKQKEKEFQEELDQLTAKLEENRKHEKWDAALKNCRDIIYLSRERNQEEIVKEYGEMKEDLKAKLVQKKQTSSLSKKYDFNWDFTAPEPILTCSIVKKDEKRYLVYGGHNRALNLLDKDANVLSSIEFDGWVRCSFPIDSDGNGSEEILVGTGDGDMLVLAFDDTKDGLVGIFHNKVKGKISCCAAADINMNGVIDYIYGGEGKKLYIFEGLKSDEAKFIIYYASWVTACTIGALKLPDSKKPRNYLLVGTQNGTLQLIQVENDDLEILWQADLGKKINDIKLGDVFNNGRNEICIACEDFSVKVLNSTGRLEKSLKMEEGRPLTLNIEDIDDDKAMEIIVGGAHGTLSIFQNEAIDSTEIELKWKTSGKTSIQTICTAYDKNSGRKQIIYGGYNRTIKNITDFDWGKKKALEIPEKRKIKLPAIKPVQKQQQIPTNLKKAIIDLFSKKLYITLEALTKDLVDFGYSKGKINAILKDMKENSSLIKQTSDTPLWTLKTDNFDIKLGTDSETTAREKGTLRKKVEESEKIREGAKDELPKGSGTQLREDIINFLNNEQPISSKSDMVDSIADLGYDQEEVSELIDILNDENIITYSRSAPQGWRLVS